MKKLKAMVTLGALLACAMQLMLASCNNGTADKNKPGQGNVGNGFDIEYIKVWGQKVGSKGTVEVSSGETKSVEVKLRNPKKFKVIVGAANASASNGVATIETVEIEKGKSKLEIVIKAEGLQDLKKEVTVIRTEGAGSFDVKIKRSVDSAPYRIADGQIVKTSDDTAELTVTSAYAMKEVKIAGVAATLAADKKQATATAKTGDVKVEVDFVDLDSKTFTFKLEKVSADALPIVCLSSKLFMGDVFSKTAKSTELIFDKDGAAFWKTASKEDIQYSLVKVEMDFDVPITARTVKCEDARSANYSTAPTNTDLAGIYSGYLVKEINEQNQETPFNPIAEKKYTEYFVVGAGEVKYEITFKAANRQETKYTVKISNTNDKKLVFESPTSYPQFTLHDVTGAGAQGNFLPCMHFPHCHKGPLYIKGTNEAGGETLTYNKDVMADLEVMDELRMIIQKVTTASNYEKEGSMYFYSVLYDSDTDAKKHEFSLRKASETQHKQLTAQNLKANHIRLTENVADKHYDCFVAFKEYLPQGAYPVYTQKKWKQVLKNGLVANISKWDSDEGTPRQNKGSLGVSHYRRNAEYVKKVQTSADPANNREAMKFYYNMSWKNWYLGDSLDTEKAEDVGGGKVLASDDFLELRLCFDPKDDCNARVTIYKSEDGDDEAKYVKDSVWDNKEVHIFKEKRLILAGVEPIAKGAKFDEKKRYQFKPNVGDKKFTYKVEVALTVGGKTCKYVYVLDYKDEKKAKEHAVALNSMRSDSGASDIFGVPTSDRFFQAMNEVNWAYVSDGSF